MAIKLINHTAISFPLVFSRDIREPIPLGFPSGAAGGQVEWYQFWYGEPQLHRFRLEMRSTGIDMFRRVTGVFAVVNGQQHNMTLLTKNGSANYYGSENWVWDSPDHSIPRYLYGFVVETQSVLFPRITRRTLYPNRGSFHAGVSMRGLVSWFHLYGNPTTSTNGNIELGEFIGPATIFVQNLTNVDAVWDVNLSGQDQQFFSINYLNSPPGALNRGDIVGLQVYFDFSSAHHMQLNTAFLDLTVLDHQTSVVLLSTRFAIIGDGYLLGG